MTHDTSSKWNLTLTVGGLGITLAGENNCLAKTTVPQDGLCIALVLLYYLSFSPFTRKKTLLTTGHKICYISEQSNYYMRFGGNLDFPKIMKFKKVLFDV